MDATIRRMGPGDEAIVLAGGGLFDDAPTPEWTADFLASPGHHLLMALDGDRAIGFVSCVEMVHPDKGRELFLYELGVAEGHRRSGVGRGLVDAALELARELGCYGAWTATEDDNAAALATYRSAGAEADTTTVTEVWDWP